MGVVCCDAPLKLAHEDIDITPRHDSSSSSASGATAMAGGSTSVATLPSDHMASNDRLASKPSSAKDQDLSCISTAANQDKTRNTKKSVRINEEATVILVLTSASFFRKTPKPATITSSGYGIMPSFRMVAPAAIASESTDSSDKDSGSDDELVPKASLWWTKEERREIHEANQRASRDFKRFQPTKIRRANLVYNEIVMDCCCRNETQENQENYDGNDIYDFFQREHHNARIAATNSGSTGPTSSSSNSCTKKRKRADFAPTVVDRADLPPPTLPDTTIDLPTNVRGLEWAVMPDAKRYRKAHVRTVLGWQERIWRMNAQQQRRRHGHDCDQDFQEEEWSSSSSSSSFSSSDDENANGRHSGQKSKTCETRSQQRHKQDLLLGQKASISSLRSCMLARVFGKSDEIAVNPVSNISSDLEKRRASSSSPTPSLTGTTDESESSDSDDDDSDSDDNESDDYSDSDSEAEDDEDRRPKRIATPSSYYRTPLSSMNANANSHRRMFRPRMMPPMGWR